MAKNIYKCTNCYSLKQAKIAGATAFDASKYVYTVDNVVFAEKLVV